MGSLHPLLIPRAGLRIRVQLSLISVMKGSCHINIHFEIITYVHAIENNCLDQTKIWQWNNKWPQAYANVLRFLIIELNAAKNYLHFIRWHLPRPRKQSTAEWVYLGVAPDISKSRSPEGNSRRWGQCFPTPLQLQRDLSACVQHSLPCGSTR